MKSVHANLHEQELQVIKRILNGEDHLFEGLVKPYLGIVFQVVECHIKLQDHIIDIVNAAINKGYDCLDQYDQQQKFFHWLICLAIRECEARNPVHVSDFDKKGAYAHIIPTDSDHDAIGQIKKIDLYAFDTKVDLLPPRYRLIYVLKLCALMRNREIAACLSITTAEVKTMISHLKCLLLQNRRNERKSVFHSFINSLKLLKKKIHLSH